MSQAVGGYGFVDRLPLDPVRPGTTVLVAGPLHDGARRVALSMVAAGEGEGESEGENDGTVIVTTSQSADRVVRDCEALGTSFRPGRIGVVDCVSPADRDPDETSPARVLAVSGPEDLTGIGMRYSKLHQNLLAEGVGRVRSGVLSVSTLLTLGDVQAVSRFVHTLVGRVGSIDGLGVLLIDPDAVDERVLSNVAQFCDARVDVREGDDTPEMRVRGLPGQSREWTAVELYG